VSTIGRLPSDVNGVGASLRLVAKEDQNLFVVPFSRHKRSAHLRSLRSSIVEGTWRHPYAKRPRFELGLRCGVLLQEWDYWIVTRYGVNAVKTSRCTSQPFNTSSASGPPPG
jgi:hypothetical protein